MIDTEWAKSQVAMYARWVRTVHRERRSRNRGRVLRTCLLTWLDRVRLGVLERGRL